MAEIQSGTKFAAIAPSTDVDRRSALINTKSLEYTIEDIAAAVSGDIDLTEYLTITDAEDTYLAITDAEETYQPKEIKLIYGTSTELSTVADNGVSFSGLSLQAGNSTCGTFTLFKGNTETWGSNGTYTAFVSTTAVLANFNSVINISIDQYGSNYSIIAINNAIQAGSGFVVRIKNIGSSITDYISIVINWSVIK